MSRINLVTHRRHQWAGGNSIAMYRATLLRDVSFKISRPNDRAADIYYAHLPK